jgi:hypothetical protein
VGKNCPTPWESRVGESCFQAKSSRTSYWQEDQSVPLPKQHLALQDNSLSLVSLKKKKKKKIVG